MIVIETAVMLGCSILAAAVLSLPIAYFLSVYGIDLSGQMTSMSVSGVGLKTVMKAAFDLKTVVAPTAVLTGVVFVSILYPATKAALLKPVDAIHHQ